MRLAFASLAIVSTLAPPARASGANVDNDANPLPRAINLQLENDLQFGVGPNEDPKYTLKLKNVFPMALGGGWHLFHRPIVQIIDQPVPRAGQEGAFGLGDLEYQLYVSPPSSPTLIWGVGPDLWFPTATATALGTGKANAGVAAAMRLSAAPWAGGFIFTQYWSYTGDPDRSSVSQMSIQPHLVFHLPEGWYLTSSPILTANWKASSGQVWTIPLGGGAGKDIDFGDQSLHLQLQGFYNVASPDLAGRWQLRFVLQWAFPRAT
jgi:hypothetical protein